MLNFLYQSAHVMPARSNAGIESLSVFKETGYLFMRYDCSILLGGHGVDYIVPVEATNNGFFIFFPIISYLTNIDYSILTNYYFHFCYLLSLVASIFFISKLTNTYLKIAISIIFTLLVYFYLYDRLFGLVVEYTLYFVATMLFIPFSLCIYYKKINNFLIYSCTVLFFVVALTLDMMKDYASFGAIIFFATVVYMSKLKNLKILSSVLILIYLILPILINNYVDNKQKENYEIINKVELPYDQSSGSIPWTTLYSGLGFIGGKVGPFSDGEAHKFLKSVKPNLFVDPVERVTTKENQRIFRSEVLRVLLSDPSFAIRLYTAKLGVILFYILAFSNIGFLYFFNNDFDRKLRRLFVINIAFYSIFPLMAVPGLGYLTGAIGVSLCIFIYTISKINLQSFIINLKKYL